jgi:hypothetical protein
MASRYSYFPMTPAHITIIEDAPMLLKALRDFVAKQEGVRVFRRRCAPALRQRKRIALPQRRGRGPELCNRSIFGSPPSFGGVRNLCRLTRPERSFDAYRAQQGDRLPTTPTSSYSPCQRERSDHRGDVRTRVSKRSLTYCIVRTFWYSSAYQVPVPVPTYP